MKRIALSLTAIGVLCLAANQAFAQRVGSHSTAMHVSAGHGIHYAGLAGSGHHIQQVGYRYGHHGYRGYRGGCGAAIVPRYVPRYSVGVPYYRSYRPYTPHYYGGYGGGFNYYGPRFSIGLGF